jgi:DUF4097 and DUF4098 domain-containing protein YvlB
MDQSTKTIALVISLLGLASSGLAATKPLAERRAAAADGVVEVINVSGTINVTAWEKNEIDISGTIGDQVERVEVTGDSHRTTIRVVVHRLKGWSGDSDANLTIKVPQRSSVDASLVSADLSVSGASGKHELRTVSGNIAGDVGGNLQVSTVSGEVRLSARNAINTKVETVSGDVTLTGPAGELTLTSVSGDASLQLGAIDKSDIETVSGNVAFSGSLASGARLQAESVSGDLRFDFAGTPGADFSVETLSGKIENCFGARSVREGFGPGVTLRFRNGDGSGRVTVETKSGDVQLCSR